MAPHVSRRRVGETWAAKGRKVPRGEGRTHVCYPHEWYQSVPHAHGVLRTARWACPHDLRAVRAAHPSARGPRKGRARAIVTCYYGSACFGGRSSLKSITPATSTINPIYTLGKLVSLPLKQFGFSLSGRQKAELLEVEAILAASTFIFPYKYTHKTSQN